MLYPLIPTNHTMKMPIDLKILQPVKCIKDNKLYVYRVDENPYFIEEDYTLIKCYLIEPGGLPDFSKLIEIYGKDLVSAD